MNDIIVTSSYITTISEICKLLNSTFHMNANRVYHNTNAIQINANPVYHKRLKHIEVDCHFIWEAFNYKIITLPHISTTLQIDGIFTKSITH